MRVPAGTTLFDAASWNGIAIDSTCGGHGTCKKCKVRVVSGTVPISPVDPRAFTDRRAAERLAARVPRRPRTRTSSIEVPPLQTRPKAALAGVGRHVILGRRCRSATSSWPSRRSRTSSSDLERLLAAMDDVELRVPLGVVRELGGTLRAADWKVTAVLADDVLIDVEAGDTTAAGHAIAFDLGTTTVVATLIDLETGTAASGAVDPERAAAVRRRRDLPHLGDHAGRRRARAAAAARARDARSSSTDEVCAEAGVDPARGLRDRRRRQPDDDPDRARHRSRAAVDGAVHRRRTRAARSGGRRLRRRRPPARAGRHVPRARRVRRRRHRRRHPRDGHHARPPRAAVHRRRHELGDRARLLGAGARDGRARRAGVRGGPDPLRDARRRRRDRGREDRRRRGRADGDRRRRAASASAAPASSTPSPSSSAPACSTTPAASSLDASRAASARSARRTSSTSASDVYLSQRDVRELQFAKASIATGWKSSAGPRHRARRDRAGAARRLVRLLPQRRRAR